MSRDITARTLKRAGRRGCRIGADCLALEGWRFDGGFGRHDFGVVRDAGGLPLFPFSLFSFFPDRNDTVDVEVHVTAGSTCVMGFREGQTDALHLLRALGAQRRGQLFREDPRMVHGRKRCATHARAE